MFCNGIIISKTPISLSNKSNTFKSLSQDNIFGAAELSIEWVEIKVAINETKKKNEWNCDCKLREEKFIISKQILNKSNDNIITMKQRRDLSGEKWLQFHYRNERIINKIAKQENKHIYHSF